MDLEDCFPETVDDNEDEEEYVPEFPGWHEQRRKRLQRKNQAVIDGFLGGGRRTNAAGILPRYYYELLTWALHRHLEREGWTIISTLGYHVPEPVYVDVNTGDKTENLVMDGQLLVEKGDSRFIITVDVNPRVRSSVQVEGIIDRKKELEAFIADILAITEEENFYRGQKIEFAGRIRFLEVKDRSWDSIVLEAETKREIMANTVEFLRRSEEWVKYGIPLKRGILLAGKPGTGKTIICRALMTVAKDITCITTSGYDLENYNYITELYDLAEDLSPCIVFIEDIDFIGQNRTEFGYQGGAALLSLLSVMDGLEEQQEIINIATTNFFETLDKALIERPSRFDRVIKLTLPSVEERREIIRRICHKIPLDDDMKEYIAIKGELCTPAQLQEIVYSLVIQSPTGQSVLSFNKSDVDRSISQINGKSKNRNRIGFCSNHNGDKPDLTATVRLG